MRGNRGKQVKVALWKHKEHICYYCRRPLTNEMATLDHVIPLSRGGRTNQKNCILSCYPCNKKKGDKFFGTRRLTKQTLRKTEEKMVTKSLPEKEEKGEGR